MDTKEILMTVTASISVISLGISYLAYSMGKKSQKHALKSFDIEHSNTLISHLKIEEESGHNLKTSFSLLNHGKNNIVIKRIELAGRAQSSVGDDYGVLNDTLGSDGAKIIEAGKEMKFDANFIVGYGNLKSMNLTAYIKGVDSKQDEFRVALPVQVKYA